MAAEVRQPVAIRVTRPYSDEDEFLEHEIDTLTRTSVTLIGAQSRPQGVILRFEVMLASGMPLMRGEGRVIAFKPNALDHLPGLTLRFTRLDKKTKALVDRAALIREERARAALDASMTESVLPPPPAADPTPVPPAPTLLTQTGPLPPAALQAEDASEVDDSGQNGHVHTVEIAVAPPPPAPPLRMESERPASERPAPVAPAPAPSSPSVAAGGGRDRDSLLLRLRERARRLAPETVAAILQDSPTSTPE
ncbi:hypothetical protein [Pendulispora albinea]|uniref:PilZ domain-containing protein n=1 Tax=Pendulispora albinea TaxID=2741071 RepID=A0ABZ2LKL4_9BACT